MNFALQTFSLLSSSTGVAMAIHVFVVLALVCSVSEGVSLGFRAVSLQKGGSNLLSAKSSASSLSCSKFTIMA